MKNESIKTPDGTEFTLILSDDGFCHCPVCGEKSKNKEWRPYGKDGNPSYDICSCGYEYGVDDGDSMPCLKCWEEYREKWLNGEIDNFNSKKISKLDKLKQLKNILR